MTSRTGLASMFRRGKRVALPAILCPVAIGAAVMPSVRHHSGAVNVYYAASLKALNELSVGPSFAHETGYTYQGFPENSGLIVNQIQAHEIQPDVVEFADASLNAQLMGSAHGNVVKWYVTFARTHLVIGYCPTSPLAKTFQKVSQGKLAWWKALLSPGLKFGRTDPNSDPKGYRTVMAFALAQKLYGGRVKGFPKHFSRRVLGTVYNPDPRGLNSASSQVYPEATLVGQVSTCNLDAGVFYLPEARAAKLPYFNLPAQVSFGRAKYGKLDAKEKYTNSAGLTTAGSPVYYTLTIPNTVQNMSGAVAFTRYVLGSQAGKAETAIGLQSCPHTLHGNKRAVPSGIR